MLATVLMSAANPYEDGYDVGPLGTWEKISGDWYFLDTKGVKATGWEYVYNKWYYFEPSGAMATGWKNLDGKWYYLGPSGDEEPGWKEVDDKSYYVGRPGVMTTGWQYIDDAWYYFKPSGEMATGLTEIDPYGLYYFNEDGILQTGWLEVDGKLYHAAPSGNYLGNLLEFNAADVVERSEAFTVSAAKKKAAEEAARIVIDEWDDYGWIGGTEIPKPTIKDLSTLCVGEAIPILNLIEGKLINTHDVLYPVIADNKIITSMVLSEEDDEGKAGGRWGLTDSVKEAGYLGGPYIKIYDLSSHINMLREGCALVHASYMHPVFLVNNETVTILKQDPTLAKESSDSPDDKTPFENLKAFMTQIPDTLLVSEPLSMEDTPDVAAQTNTDSSSTNAGTFAVNEFGQTYGGVPEPKSMSQPMDAEEFYKTYWPDLVSVRATNGKDGYVYRDELFVVPANPEEAAKLDQSEKEPLTVYESDGRTVVGIWEQN